MIGIPEVLLARIASGRAYRSKSANTEALRSAISGTASITRSAPATAALRSSVTVTAPASPQRDRRFGRARQRLPQPPRGALTGGFAGVGNHDIHPAARQRSRHTRAHGATSDYRYLLQLLRLLLCWAFRPFRKGVPSRPTSSGPAGTSPLVIGSTPGPCSSPDKSPRHGSKIPRPHCPWPSLSKAAVSAHWRLGRDESRL